MIELHSPRASAIIDPVTGGRLVSLVIDGHEVIGAVPTVKEIVRKGQAAEHDWYRGSFPLAPWAGALREGTFVFDGTTHHVQLDSAGTAKHGVVAERPWDIEETLDQTSAILSIQFGPDFPGRWPFSAGAVQSFVLEESALLMRLEVHSSEPRMPAIAGFHPWFRSQLNDGATASITFLPSSKLTYREGILVADDELGSRPWDNAFVGLAEPPVISWAGGPRLRLESDASVWVYYETLPGAFCIEPWTGPFEGLETKWSSVVTPDEPLVLNFTIWFD